MPTEFQHKGVTISLDGNGAFRFLNKGSKFVTKPSLRAAQNAIDKEVGRVIVPAMTGDGKKVEIAGTHRTRGYIDSTGRQVGKYEYLYRWSEETAQKITALRAQENALLHRHYEEAQELAKERQRTLSEAGIFSYTDGVEKEIAQTQKEQSDA